MLGATIRSRERPKRGDIALYDELVDQWWHPQGPFMMLHWLAAARGRLVPEAARSGAVLVDLGCGAGLLAPHVADKGYRHIGVDRSLPSLRLAAEHGVEGVLGDVRATPLDEGCADVVVAGEILEHVPDLPGTVAEACRLLRPGGALVIDTLANTVLCRWVAIELAERVLRLAPRGIHDPKLLVDRGVLLEECARHGVPLALRGVRPSVTDLAAWYARRRTAVRMVPTFSTAMLFQGYGRKRS